MQLFTSYIMNSYLKLDGGMFHDAGKLYFLDTINLFARALFNEEFDLIRLHPQMCYELLNKWDSTRPYAEAALYHHLWYDEKGGYPREYTYKGNDNAILYQILFSRKSSA